MAARLLYRAMLRECRQLRALGGLLEVRQPLDLEAYQRSAHKWSIINGPAYHKDLLQALVPRLLQAPDDGMFTTESLRSCIRANFAAGSSAPPSRQSALLDQAFSGLRILSEQLHLLACTSMTMTEGILVEVTSTFLQTVQGPGGRLHSFTYRCRVQNVSNAHRVQLLGRGWEIINSRSERVGYVPPGSRGVVGCTPILKPGDCFEYYSSSGVDTDEGGKMQGCFQMVELAGSDRLQKQFDAVVGPFALLVPRSAQRQPQPDTRSEQ